MPSLFASDTPAANCIPISNGSGVLDPDWIGDNSVELDKLVPISPSVLLGNNTLLAANPAELTVAQSLALLGLSPTNSPTFAGLTLYKALSAIYVPLSVIGDGAQIEPNFRVYSGTDANAAPVLDFLKSRGSQASPVALQSGDRLGGISFGGQYDTSSDVDYGSAIRSYTIGAWAANSAPAELRFYTRQASDTGGIVLRATLKDAGTWRWHAYGAGIVQTDASGNVTSSAYLNNVTNDAQVKRSEMGAALGVATLDAGGLLPVAQLPPIAVVDFLGTVVSQAAMLALTGQKGDWCIRSDLGTSWIITGADPSILAGWTQLAYPASPVLSVFGRTGTVTAQATDYSAYYDTLGAAVAVTPTTLGLVIGTNTQAHSAKLDTFAALADAAGWLHSNGSGTYAWSVPAISDIFSATQSANAIYAGPASGAAAAPTFRAMVAADLGTALAPTFNRLIVNRNASLPAPLSANYGLDVIGADGATTQVAVETYGGIPSINTIRAQGTATSKTAIVNTNVISQFRASGWDGTSLASLAAILITATEDWTSTKHGCTWSAAVIQTGTSATSTALTLTGAGNMTLNLATETGLTGAGNLSIPTAILTGSPTGGTAAAWKLGSKVTTTSAFNTTGYIQLEVSGVAYKLAICV